MRWVRGEVLGIGSKWLSVGYASAGGIGGTVFIGFGGNPLALWAVYSG